MVRLDIDYKMEQMDQQIQALTKDVMELRNMLSARLQKAYAEGYRDGYKDGKGPECYYARRTR